mmetsp:Transcript_125447/g.267836  ORF Transcript_125447/g.267836 Transcript_125447/m.267836 type:complete len:935 (-) Transcript_125447:67-2871(-)
MGASPSSSLTSAAGRWNGCIFGEDVASLQHSLQYKVIAPAAVLVFIRSEDNELSESPVKKTKRASRALNVVHTSGQGSTSASVVEEDHAQHLKAFTRHLEDGGVDTACWSKQPGCKSVEHLYWEVHQVRGCFLTGMVADDADPIKRVVRLVKIRLIAEIFGEDHILHTRLQFMHDGQCQEKKQIPLRKLQWKEGITDDVHAVEANLRSSMVRGEHCIWVEDWKSGYRRALEERLGLSYAWQSQHLKEQEHLYSYHTEDNRFSEGWPGLNTLYCIHEVTLRVIDTHHAHVQNIGLPGGQEFATAEGNFSLDREDGIFNVGTRLNIWVWARLVASPYAEALAEKNFQPMRHVGSKNDATTASKEPDIKHVVSNRAAATSKADMAVVSKQVLFPLHFGVLLDGEINPDGRENLRSLMLNRKTNWARVKNAAKKIMDPTYSLAAFNKDLEGFPELSCYLLDDGPRVPGCQKLSNSGRTGTEEWQRTIGAFFAIYWLMRLSIDGKEGFSFGVTQEWDVVKPETSAEAKRQTFFKDAKWDLFRNLLVDADLIEERKSLSGKVHAKANEKRVSSLLALTAFHDIMKVGMLGPEVQGEHAPYHGYKAGERIADHDYALSYIMDHYPQLLPSFRDLDRQERRSLQFTQCDIAFNHGWFVQGEAPPGATFTKFRDALQKDPSVKISRRDVALYFVHWITDLAGAEPTPLGGCEKFVLKFPLPVLNTFLRSFEFVERIAEQTETEVMEAYLKTRWEESSFGPPPIGDSAIAKMRILCMAQMSAAAILGPQGFDMLSEEDQEVLSVEMARTGCIAQSYSRGIVPLSVIEKPQGPALLIYYGPALLQNLRKDDPVKRLFVLAEVYRSARQLWPVSADKVAVSVIIRIDTLKAMSCAEMLEAVASGDVFLIVKHNESEAFIERSSIAKLNTYMASRHSVQVLDLAPLR